MTIFFNIPLQLDYNNHLFMQIGGSTKIFIGTLMEYDQMSFFFQHSPLCSSHTSSISIAVLRCHLSKMSSIADIITSFIVCVYIYIYIYIYNSNSLYTRNYSYLTMIICLHTVGQWIECFPMAQKTSVQSQVESYQRLKK